MSQFKLFIFCCLHLAASGMIVSGQAAQAGKLVIEPYTLKPTPALFISGTLDTNTPPFQAEEVRWGFPNSAHLIVENGGHETLPGADVQRVVVDFFKGQSVAGRTVTFERPRFLSVEEAKKPPADRR